MNVSIITVVRNAEKTIEKTIQSVINQTYDDYEYIIIDGCSTDATNRIIETYLNHISKYISEPDAGIYDAMNKGISLANGKWIYFLGADDTLYSDDILELVFDSDYKDDDVIYGNVLLKESGVIFDGEFDYEKLCSKSPCHQAIFYRKELFNRCGVFDLKYRTTADYVLHINTLRGGSKWRYIERIIAVYNETGASYSQRDVAYLNDRFEIRLLGFAELVNEKLLARIFLSSFWRFLITHPIKRSLQNLRILFSHMKWYTILVVIYEKYTKNEK